MNTSNNNNHDFSVSSFELFNVPTKLNNVDSLIRVSQQQKAVMMPNGYVPSDFDVCSGRGKQNWNHSGNTSFRRLIRMSVDRYLAAPCKSDKTAVVVSIVEKIRQLQGHFLKQDGKVSWYDIGDAAAREKVGHSLRDQVGSAANAGRPRCKSPLQQAKEQTRHAATTATAVKSGECDSLDAAATAATAAAATAAASPTDIILSSSSTTTYDVETSDASIQPTTLRRRASSSLDPLDIVWSSDISPTSLSRVLSLHEYFEV
jgi:hypothetical protein